MTGILRNGPVSFGTMTAYECPGAAVTARGVDDPEEVDVSKPSVACPVCGTAFVPVRGGGPARLQTATCSRSCGQTWRQRREPHLQPVCSIEGCESPNSSRGWCRHHYNLWHKHGDPMGAPVVTSSQRFWAKVHVGPVPEYRSDLGPCWLWGGAINRDGYGSAWIDGAAISAHIYSFIVFGGQPPGSAGLELDHLCRVRRCLNPTHLELVTHAENMRRSRDALRQERPS